MATFVFDTHRAVKNLKDAGFAEAQAEALVEIVGGAIGESVATKADLQALEHRITLKFIAILLPCLGLLFAAMRFLL